MNVTDWKPNFFEAKYPGTCTDCFERIEPGDLIAYDPQGHLVHENCADGESKPVGEVCTECFMEKSLSGDCGCTR